jgi:transposase InsO family protein
LYRKSNGCLHEPSPVRYQFVDQHRGQYSLERLCEALQVSVSGYYAWQKRPESTRKQENKRIVAEIKEIHRQSRETYGSPRIHVDLQEKGMSCSENRVARLMKSHRIAAKRKRKFVVTTDSNHALPVAENKLNQQFTASKANEKWVTDITYVWTREGWLYLAVVLDLFSRKVVGWAMDASMERGLVIRALQMALLARKPEKGLLHHSDRGSQYASNDYQKLLSDNGMDCFMSRKGNCYDNACMESFFATLKQELVYHRQYQTRKEAKQDIFEYIQVWYNRKRRHSALGYVSPEQYENKGQYRMAA